MKLMTMHNNGTTKIDIEKELQSQRHGSPYDRGSADSYYSRKFNPHYYVADTLDSDMVEMKDMTPEQIVQYAKGFKENEDAGNFKEW
jgi:hypothetical protein|tara:strand:+ start:317 stop:577 length:261 start_codon:yes stop_codon:yes gene_type:complete